MVPVDRVAVGTALAGGPRTDPYVRNYLIRLLPRVDDDDKSLIGVRMQDLGFR
jgi:hypothetical protein